MRSRGCTFFLGLAIAVMGLLPLESAAQQLALPPLSTDFGEPPDSLLALDEYPFDPDAPYFYAFKKADIRFEDDDRSVVAVIDYHVRVKVFDDSTQAASLVAIPYYFQNNLEEVDQIRGVTISPDGERSKLSENDIRTININSRYNVKEFSLPDVQDGSVMDYTYQIRRRYIDELPDFFLADRAPVEHAELQITYPQYLRYDVVPVNFNGQIRHQAQEIDTSSVEKIFTKPRPDPILRERWSAGPIDDIEDLPYISSLDDYRGKLKFKLSEFGNPRQELDTSWEYVIAELQRRQKPLQRIEDNQTAFDMGQEIADETTTAGAAQDSIFRVVNEAANFSGDRAPFSQVMDQTVLAGQVSDQPAINQTLIAMLRGAGIEAYPLLISTREFGKIERSFPSFLQFNGQLVYSEIDDRSYIMDASYANSQPGVIPTETYNGEGLVLKSKSFEWVDVDPVESRYDLDISIIGALEPDGSLSGRIEAESNGYSTRFIRDELAGGANEQEVIREVVFEGFGDITLSNVEISRLNAFNEHARIEADFELPDYAVSFSDGLEYRPMLLGRLTENPFEDDERDIPVTLDAPERLRMQYKIALSQGFTLGEGAENSSVSLDGARLDEAYRAESDTIAYEFEIDLQKKEYPPEDFAELYELYDRWVEISNATWLIESN